MRHLLTAFLMVAMAGAADAGQWEDAFGGDAAAQLKLGDLYVDGNDVPQDHGEAVKWYCLAADQGNAAAQYRLGRMSARGDHMPQNYTEALRLFRLAADQGYTKALYNLVALCTPTVTACLKTAPRQENSSRNTFNGPHAD